MGRSRICPELPLGGELQHAVFVLARGEAKEEAGFLLPLQFPNPPAFEGHMPFVEAPFEGSLIFKSSTT